jgi:hypothetical protein
LHLHSLWVISFSCTSFFNSTTYPAKFQIHLDRCTNWSINVNLDTKDSITDKSKCEVSNCSGFANWSINIHLDTEDNIADKSNCELSNFGCLAIVHRNQSLW